jgi:adenosylcobinamide-GDP ribazoletransferase
VWAYPIAGAVTGLIGGLVYWILHSIGVPPALAAVFAVGALMVATGALHDDGFGDTADGFGGGSDRERKLEIMRDSRVGSYAVVALVLVLALRIVAIGLLACPGAVFAALVATGALSRGGIGLFMSVIPAARVDGMSAAVGIPSGARSAEGAAIALLVAFLVLSPGAAILALVFAALGMAIVGYLAVRQIDGQTGDVIGAAVVVAECAALTAIVAVAG